MASAEKLVGEIVAKICDIPAYNNAYVSVMPETLGRMLSWDVRKKMAQVIREVLEKAESEQVQKREHTLV